MCVVCLQVSLYCEMKRTKDAQLIEEVHALRWVGVHGHGHVHVHAIVHVTGLDWTEWRHGPSEKQHRQHTVRNYGGLLVTYRHVRHDHSGIAYR
jgi:hypothetical protein